MRTTRLLKRKIRDDRKPVKRMSLGHLDWRALLRCIQLVLHRKPASALLPNLIYRLARSPSHASRAKAQLLTDARHLRTPSYALTLQPNGLVKTGPRASVRRKVFASVHLRIVGESDRHPAWAEARGPQMQPLSINHCYHIYPAQPQRE